MFVKIGQAMSKLLPFSVFFSFFLGGGSILNVITLKLFAKTTGEIWMTVWLHLGYSVQINGWHFLSMRKIR